MPQQPNHWLIDYARRLYWSAKMSGLTDMDISMKMNVSLQTIKMIKKNAFTSTSITTIKKLETLVDELIEERS